MDHTVRQMLFINQTIPANHPKEGLVVFHIFMSERIIFGEQKPNKLCYNQLPVIYFETIKYKYVQVTSHFITIFMDCKISLTYLKH